MKIKQTAVRKILNFRENRPSEAMKIRLLKEMDPFIDGQIRKLGVHPNDSKVYGMSYLELLSEAYAILLMHVVPNYRERKGDLVRYSKCFLSKELPKRLYRNRRRFKKEVPFTDMESFRARRRPWEGPSNEEDLFLDFPDLARRNWEYPAGWLGIVLEKLLKQGDPTDRHLLEELIRDGKFPPLRKSAVKLAISPATLCRRRRALVKRIMDFL